MKHLRKFLVAPLALVAVFVLFGMPGALGVYVVPTVGGAALATQGQPLGLTYEQPCDDGSLGLDVSVKLFGIGGGVSACQTSDPFDGPPGMCGDMYNPVDCVTRTCRTYCISFDFLGHVVRHCFDEVCTNQ